jgi:SAM-dependent methyltransferase
MRVPADISEIHASVAAYYSNTLAVHGPGARGVDWKDDASQRLRHRQFLRLLDGDLDACVADLGCGCGSFLGFLREHGHRGTYLGYDISPAMIATAERLHGVGSDRQWIVAGSPTRPVDYVIASGIFNVKQNCPTERWESYVDDTVEQMASAGRRGFGFNVLSVHSDPDRRRADLFYADPAVFLGRFTRRYGRHFALLQDYGLHEFTLLIRLG